jgi:heptosyltransferase-2
MPASPEFVSADVRNRLDTTQNLLVCGVNWLGDAVMTLPALTAFRAQHPDLPITLLVRRSLLPFWRCVPGFGQTLEFERGWRGTWMTRRRVRNGAFDVAVIQPHSFRSACIPFWAGIPVRIGLPGHVRDYLLTHRIQAPLTDGRRHQAWESVDLFGLKLETLPPPPYLDPPLNKGGAILKAAGLDPDRARIAILFPGAARGPSKRWPARYFAEIGRRLERDSGVRVVLAGTEEDRQLCDEVRDAIQGRAVNLAGRTDLIELAAILKVCMLVVANDSGGMHLAAAVGTPVVGIFGLTDPARTAPLGSRSRVVSDFSVQKARDIARDSDEAQQALERIEPDRVWAAIRELSG